MNPTNFLVHTTVKNPEIRFQKTIDEHYFELMKKLREHKNFKMKKLSVVFLDDSLFGLIPMFFNSFLFRLCKRMIRLEDICSKFAVLYADFPICCLGLARLMFKIVIQILQNCVQTFQTLT